MNTRVLLIASHTFREAVRDRVLYNLVVFAAIMCAAAVLIGEVSIAVEKLMVINLGLASISLLGVIIAVLAGIGLVSKEIEKRTLYTLLSRPVRRWEFILGKYLGLVGTLAVNTVLMGIGLFAAIAYVSRGLHPVDWWVLAALYFIILQVLIVCSLSILFSTFSSTLLSSLFSFALFLVGSLHRDLTAIAQAAHGLQSWLVMAATYVVPNISTLNIATSVAHGQPVARALIVYNTLYSIGYVATAVSAAVLIFERRDLK